MNKKSFIEADIRTKFITPALVLDVLAQAVDYKQDVSTIERYYVKRIDMDFFSEV